MTDITPPFGGRQAIEAYGAHGFRISGVVYRGAVIVFPDTTIAWPVTALTGVTAESLAPVSERAGGEGEIDILLLGCGRRTAPISPTLRAELKRVRITIDAMDTGAACRTYDVLATEGRRVAAALLPLA
ncbi:MAG: Mth938-like domain-containing protein [Stellaceae bacterium]